jgi:ATP synthase protein I
VTTEHEPGGEGPERPGGRRPSGAPELPEVLREAPPSDVHPSPKPAVSSLAQGFALGTDLVVSTAAGLVVGWLLDRWLGTAPLGMLIGLGAGMIGAVIRLLRRTAKASGKVSVQAPGQASGQASARR